MAEAVAECAADDALRSGGTITHAALCARSDKELNRPKSQFKIFSGP